MFKKITVLAMAVGVVAAFALPASASAAWKHHNTAIQQNVQIGLTGNARFQSTLGGVECQITSRTTFNPGTTGTAETFVPHPTSDTSNCKGLGGLSFCQIHNLTPQAPNWTIHTAAFQTQSLTNPSPGTHHTVAGTTHQNAATVTTQTIHSQATGGFCPVTTISLTAGTVGVLPEEAATITNANLSGILQADVTTTNGVVHKEHAVVSGTVQIENVAQRATYTL